MCKFLENNKNQEMISFKRPLVPHVISTNILTGN